ncbi:Oidioi.mRNA.OKI2018_I69.PAR.g13222.t1.cds [Oikopleura dioica]|uniref:Oidioi.mRNA.OKI2018_I69.PAR.g13222.t1.cds n=1 Tax=Oikopleura dioica TaxID=34765 RepID=A0ABN7S3R2_OIKDI|nr:Oidioi.mRNA.OKI2018_I69.PAR.g13222.t1.cds [Oikopleura dioica]
MIIAAMDPLYNRGGYDYANLPLVEDVQLPLPAELAPSEDPFLLNNITEEGARAVYNRFMDWMRDGNPTIGLYQPENEIMSRAHDLRHLKALVLDLHHENSTFEEYLGEIFPVTLIKRSTKGCKIPFCTRSDCRANKDVKDELFKLVEEYATSDRNPNRGDQFLEEARSKFETAEMHKYEKEIMKIENCTFLHNTPNKFTTYLGMASDNDNDEIIYGKLMSIFPISFHRFDYNKFKKEVNEIYETSRFTEEHDNLLNSLNIEYTGHDRDFRDPDTMTLENTKANIKICKDMGIGKTASEGKFRNGGKINVGTFIKIHRKPEPGQDNLKREYVEVNIPANASLSELWIATKEGLTQHLDKYGWEELPPDATSYWANKQERASAFSYTAEKFAMLFLYHKMPILSVYNWWFELSDTDLHTLAGVHSERGIDSHKLHKPGLCSLFYVMSVTKNQIANNNQTVYMSVGALDPERETTKTTNSFFWHVVTSMNLEDYFELTETVKVNNKRYSNKGKWIRTKKSKELGPKQCQSLIARILFLCCFRYEKLLGNALEYAMFQTYDCLNTIELYGLQNLLRVGFFNFQFYQIAVPAASYIGVEIDMDTCQKPITRLPAVSSDNDVAYPQMLKGFCEIYIGRITLANNRGMRALRHVTTYKHPPLYPHDENIKTILDRITTFNNVEQLILQTLYRNADLERDNYALMQALFDAKKNTPVEESNKNDDTEELKAKLQNADTETKKLQAAIQDAENEVKKQKLIEKELTSKTKSLERKIQKLMSEGEVVTTENGNLRELLEEEKTENQSLKREIASLKLQNNC